MPSLLLILFDIDQTLIYTAGAGLRSMGRAILEVTGVDLDHCELHPEGKTDPQILAEALGTAQPSAAVQAEIWRRYERYLEVEMARPDPRRAVKPGVHALLEALQGRDDVTLGLLTGNLEATARIKLAPYDLNRFFPTGAFGSDSADRCQLGAIALERARRHHGHPFEPRDVWVVGDTDRDIQAARALGPGTRVLAVATGSQDVTLLSSFQPDAVLSDLSDTTTVVQLLTSSPAPAP